MDALSIWGDQEKAPFGVREAPDGALRMEKFRELPGRAVAVSVNVSVAPVLVILFPSPEISVHSEGEERAFGYRSD